MKVEPVDTLKDGMTLREEVFSQWQELWRDFLRDTSLQGCKYIPCHKRHVIVRILWLLLVLTMIGLLLVTLANLYCKYYSYNFTTKITRERRQLLRLPDITICNKNRFDITKRNLTSAELKYVLSRGSLDFMFESVDWNGEDGRELEQVDYKKFWGDASYDAKDMFELIFLNSFYKSSSMSESKRWNRLCFTFSAFAHEVEMEVDDSLKIMINIMQWTYVNGSIYEAGVEIYQRRGDGDLLYLKQLILKLHNKLPRLGKVYIHEAEETSYSQPSSVAVPVGLSTKLKLNRKEMLYLPAPYNSRGTDCVDTKASDFVNSLEWFNHYSFDACLEECQIKAATAACNCTAGMEPHHVQVNQRHCSIKEVHVCYSPAYKRESKKAKKGKSCSCLQECEQTSYDIQVSSMPTPSNLTILLAKMAFAPSVDSLKNDHLVLEIRFASMIVDRTEHIPTMSFIDIFARVGGEMGLFLGAGILTLVELMELVTACVHAGFTSLWARRKPRT